MPEPNKQNRIRVRGSSRAPIAAPASADRAFTAIVDSSVRAGSSFDLALARSGAAEEHAIDCASDDVVELQLEGHLRIYTSVARLQEELLPREQARGGSKGLVIPHRLEVRNQRSRGTDSVTVEGFQILDIKGKVLDFAAEKGGAAAALKIADMLEDQLVGHGGLFSIGQISAAQGDDSPQPKPLSENDIDASRPALIFIHGTASSSFGSFSDLWTLNPDSMWTDIEALYGDNIFAFEHRTLTQSPIRNALELINSLPAGLTVHLVSHSRGGLVGELLCRGQFSDGREPFDADDMELFEEKDNSYLERIFSLGVDKKDYQRHREDLAALNTALRDSGLEVARFVRVACPARGTTLASGKLDLYLSTILNIIGLIPVLRASGIYDFLKALALATAKQRTAPEVLPGLEAMMPDSPLVAMLNGTRETTRAHLAVIAGDIEPSGIFKKIAIALVDRFYESDHDLVVNTPSMDGGIKRLGAIGLLDCQGNQVNHFSYFANRASRQGLLAALRTAGLPPGFSTSEQAPTVIARSLPRGRKSGEVPAVFILPGISGSHIQKDGNRIWIDVFDLIRGKFSRLEKVDTDDVEPDGPVAKFYGDLADYLGQTHEVIPFAYDWRRSILQASGLLAAAVEERLRNTDQPVRILAHSMGGLVTRGMMTAHKPVWDRLRGRDGSRILMLGTPNNGSHSILRLLANQDKLIKWLGRIDLRNNAYDLINILSRFPGVLELLPILDEKVFEPALWDDLQQILGKDGGTRWKKPTQAALAGAVRTWKTLAETEFDPEHVFYVAGRAPETPVAIETLDGKISIKATPLGDGQVPWETGIPAGVKHWFVDAVHGDLANHAPAFEAILQILERGETRLLATQAPLPRGADTRTEMFEDTVDVLPTEDMLAAAALGGSVYRKKAVAESRPTIDISVCHGNLRFTRFPVMVSHYRDDTIVSAEAELDRQLDGRLSELYRIGIYPGSLGTNEVLINHPSQFPGAIIVGLGEVGELAPGKLTDTFREALLRFALRFRETPEFNYRPIAVASLLIGTGAGGLALDDALAAMLRASVEANQLLAGEAGNLDNTIHSLQFIELFEDVAVSAQHILQQLATSPIFRQRVNVAAEVYAGDGGHRRVSFGEDQRWWQRLRIEKEQDEGGLKFVSLTRRARVPMRTLSTQLASVEPFLEAATRDTSAQSEAGRVLFELLVPYDFKDYAREKNNLVLVVDDHTAIYPWELLRYGGRDGNEAIALNAGVIRQLATFDDERPNLCHNRRALVIGDPPSNFPELRGAQEEAAIVHALLEQELGASQLLHKPSGSQVLTQLMTREYQILHLAGHGAYEYPLSGGEKPVTGMVIGDNHFLTPAEIRQMPATPEFVFINCCHLGAVKAQESAAKGKVHRLAANLATQLIRQGVRAVIAAGWEVDDAAAQTFAGTFYRNLLRGEAFGEAVFQARLATHEKHPLVDTWGAYQCYGDQGYRIDTGRQSASTDAGYRFVTLSEAVAELGNICQDAKTTTNAGASELRQRLDDIEQALPPTWLQCGELLAPLAQAWGELDNFARAISLYTRALGAENGQGNIRSMEQRANFRARQALEQAEQAHSLRASGEAGPSAKPGLRLLADAKRDLEQLNRDHGETVERCALLGSTAKRWAAFAALTGERSAGMRSAALERVDEMAEAYGRAHALAMERDGGIYAYPLVNALAAQWLATVLDGRRKLPADFHELLNQAQASTPVPELDREHFWNAINREDCALLRALSRGSLDDDWQEICDNYQAVLRVAASPRQFRSVREHIGVLATLVSCGGDAATARALMDLTRKLQG